MTETENISHQWLDKARDTYDQARMQASTWDEKLKRFAQEKPLTAILCAVAGGYTLARLSATLR
jgi:hypothetical protein